MEKCLHRGGILTAEKKGVQLEKKDSNTLKIQLDAVITQPARLSRQKYSTNKRSLFEKIRAKRRKYKFQNSLAAYRDFRHDLFIFQGEMFGEPE